MSDEINWAEIRKAQSGQNVESERGDSLITNCNESANKMISHETFERKGEKEDK